MVYIKKCLFLSLQFTLNVDALMIYSNDGEIGVSLFFGIF